MLALSFFGLSPVAVLAGGTFGGLVIGLGAQPLLANFFAGLIVLFTRYIEVGDEIRVFSPRLPYDRASSPAYKFFSPDYVYVGYRGRVVDVGLLYSTMVTDEGLELKIPNTVIFDAAIVNYRPRYSSSRIYQVRYEYKVDFDPEMVLGMVKKALADIREVREVVLNEQSDKEYYIIRVKFQVPVEENWSLLKSEILKRLISVHRALRVQLQASPA